MIIYFFIGLGVIAFVGIYLIYHFFVNRITRYKKKLNAALRIKDYIGALDPARRLLSLHPRSADYNFQLADIYLKAKMTGMAKDVYKKMLDEKIFSLSIREHNIREKLALINLETNNMAEAFRELYMIYKRNTQSPLTLCLLGRMYASQKKYDKAEAFLKNAINVKPNESEYHYQLALVYLDIGDLETAYTELNKAHQLDPLNLKAQYFLALAARQKGLKEKANYFLEKLNLMGSPDLPDNITQIGITTQNIPKFEIDELEAQLNQEFLAISSKEEKNIAHDIETLLHANTEMLYNTVLMIISKMGYIIQKEIKSKFIDPSTQIDVIAIPKKDRESLTPTAYYIQFTRTKSELGSIPFHDFIDKINEASIMNAVLIITSTFNTRIFEELTKIKKNITLIDANKLTRYL